MNTTQKPYIAVLNSLFDVKQYCVRWSDTNLSNQRAQFRVTSKNFITAVF